MLTRLATGHWPIFLMSAFSSMANLYLPIFLARTLAAEQMGVYKIFFLHLGAIPFVFLAGAPLHSVYYWVGREKDEQKTFLQQSFLLALILSSFILVLGFPLKTFIMGITSLKEEHVALMLLAGFLSVPSDFYSHVKIALGSTVKGSAYDMVWEVAKVTAFIAIAYYTKDLGSIFLAFCAIFGLKLIVSIGLKIKDGLFSLKVNVPRLKEVFSYCLPISLAGLVTFFVDKMDQFVLAAKLPTEEFAFYSMGCLIIPPLYIMEMSVTSVLVPKLSKAWTSGEESLEYFKKSMGDIAFLLIPAAFGLWTFADPIVELLYTEKFSASGKFLKMFALSYFALIIPYDAVPRATGRTKWIFKLTLLMGFFSLAGVLFMSTYYGALETLAAALFFKLAARLAGLAYSAKIMGWSLPRVFPWSKLLTFLALSFLLTMACLAFKSRFENELAWFLFCAPAFAFLYLGILWTPIKRGYFYGN